MTGYVDAHHHLWTLEEHPQTWMDPVLMAVIQRDFGAAELAQAAVPAGVVGTVVVQTVNDAAETGHLLARAAASPLIVGVVGWADLTAPDLVDQIAQWREQPGGERLVGMRHLVQNEPDPHWLDRPAVRTGLRTLTRAGLTYDLLVTATQLDAAVRVVQDLTETRFVLDHLAKPPYLTGSLEGWAAGIRQLAQAPNVSAKISGLVTEADWSHWRVDDLAPAVEVALESFGPHRLMFGSDWPVCLLASSYAGVVSTAEQLVAGLSQAEREQIFCHTARDVYRWAT